MLTLDNFQLINLTPYLRQLLNRGKLTISDGLVIYDHDRIYVPCKLRSSYLDRFHTLNISIHLGINQMKREISKE